MTKITKKITDELDAHVKKEVATKLEANGEDPGQLKMGSLSLSSFTPAVFFERLNGDYQIVQNAEKFWTEGLMEPHRLGPCANMDERSVRRSRLDARR